MSFAFNQKPASLNARSSGATNARSRATTQTGQKQRDRYASPQRKPTTVPGAGSTTRRSRPEGRMDQDEQNPAENARGQGGTPPEQQPQYRNAYTVIGPNQRKRNQIQQQAEKETKEYEEYKERNKMGYINLPPQTVGGGNVLSKSHVTVRQQQSIEHRQITATRQGFGAKTSYKASLRAKEEVDAREKKAKARSQTEKNKQKELTREQKLDEDRRKRNDEFLKRFEQKVKQPQNTTSSVTVSHVTSVDSFESQPQASSSNYSSNERGVDPDIQMLQGAFPDKTTDELCEALTSSYGNVDVAANLLMGI